MLGKMIAGASRRFSTTGKESQKMYDIFDGARIDASEIPRAPRTAFRKRPVKLQYDKNEYWTFRLPSEDAQLLGPFNKEEIFGKYDGVNYSPHIKS